jgi:hypothetical protein
METYTGERECEVYALNSACSGENQIVAILNFLINGKFLLLRPQKFWVSWRYVA